MFPVEKGIPLPEKAERNKWPFGAMEVGDSFAFPPELSRTVRNAASSYQRNREVKFTIREGRCWRTA